MKTCLKDEPIKPAKVAQGKVRVFTIGPVVFSLVVRMYLLTLARVMQLQPFLFGAMVGVDCHSDQWSQTFDFMEGPNQWLVFDGDYSNFDKILVSELTQNVKEFILDLCKVSDNYSSSELTIVENLLTATLSPVVDVFGTFVEFASMNTSGNPLTVQINCIANNLLVRYCFLSKMRETRGLIMPRDSKQLLQLFQDEVRVITYGDDLVVSMRTPLFSCTDMQSILSKHGMDFTDAQKNSVAKPYSNWANVTFLKRRFLVSDLEGTLTQSVFPPLEFESLAKALQFYQKDSEEPFDMVMRNKIISVLLEAFYYGPTVHKELFDIAIASLQKYQESKGLPSHREAVVEQFFTNTHGLVLNYDFWLKRQLEKESSRFVDAYFDNIRTCRSDAHSGQASSSWLSRSLRTVFRNDSESPAGVGN
jgi:hypothetical protein